MSKRRTTTNPETISEPQEVTVAEILATPETVTPPAPTDPEVRYLPIVGNEAQFEALLNEAYDKVSYLWIRYHKQADEDTNTKEEITDRWVLPMTKIYGVKKHRYFHTECLHARAEKDAAILLKEKRAFKMTTDRIFRLDRVEAFCTKIRPLTERNPHYAELLNTYPQLRQRLGLKAIWIKVTDENTGEQRSERVIVLNQ